MEVCGGPKHPKLLRRSPRTPEWHRGKTADAYAGVPGVANRANHHLDDIGSHSHNFTRHLNIPLALT